MLLVDDRGADLQVGEVAKNGFWISHGAAAACRRWLRADQLCFRDHTNRRVAQGEPLGQRSHADPEWFGVADKA